MHQQDASDLNQLKDRRSARVRIEETLLGNADLKSELEAQVTDFFSRFNQQMAATEFPEPDQEEVLVWPEAALHITGLYDFQSARCGSRLSNLVRVEGDIGVHVACGQEAHPDGVYDYEAYIEDLYRGYEAVAGCRPEADEANAGNRTRTDIT